MKIKKKKICIVLTSLSNGGTERFGAIQSKMLSDLGYDVHIVITKNKVEYDYCGTLFNLETKTKKNLLGKLLTLNSFFNKNKFSVIIDNRGRSSWLKELLFWRVFYRNSRRIAMVHNYKTENYFPVNKSISRVIYIKDTIFICVSEKIKEKINKIYGFKHVKTIYNPIDSVSVSKNLKSSNSLLNYQYIIYFGRLEEASKNLTLLINSYYNSILKDKNIKLLIMGKGQDLPYLQDLVSSLNLQNDVIFISYKSNPFSYVKNALFTVLSSRYEGFPMSIIESLVLETPVVSVDCNSGPSEIIEHRRNGLLVENSSVEKLSKALNEMITDKELYNTCKLNAKKSVMHLDISQVKKQWRLLIEDE